MTLPIATLLSLDFTCNVLLPHPDGLLLVRPCAHRLTSKGPPESWQQGRVAPAPGNRAGQGLRSSLAGSWSCRISARNALSHTEPPAHPGEECGPGCRELRSLLEFPRPAPLPAPSPVRLWLSPPPPACWGVGTTLRACRCMAMSPPRTGLPCPPFKTLDQAFWALCLSEGSSWAPGCGAVPLASTC